MQDKSYFAVPKKNINSLNTAQFKFLRRKIVFVGYIVFMAASYQHEGYKPLWDALGGGLSKGTPGNPKYFFTIYLHWLIMLSCGINFLQIGEKVYKKLNTVPLDWIASILFKLNWQIFHSYHIYTT